MLRFGDAVEGQQFAGGSQSAHRGSVGLWRRFEPRDGALEKQLVARGIGGAEIEEPLGARSEKLRRCHLAVRLRHPLGELRGHLREHGVVDGVLRFKVGVNGRRGDARTAG